MTRVSIVMGSHSDLPIMENCMQMLDQFEIEYEVRVLSAHRTPIQTHAYAKELKARGIQVVIAGAGGAAHLAGVLASATILPVIGVPIDATSLQGMDALLATVQMPKGIPVATVAIGKAGASNAAILAVQMLATHDVELSEKLVQFKEDMAQTVLENSIVK